MHAYIYTIAGVQVNRVQSVTIITVALVAANSVVAVLRAVVTVLHTLVNIYEGYPLFKLLLGKCNALLYVYGLLSLTYLYM